MTFFGFKPAHKIEAALAPKVDVHERDVRPDLISALKSLSGCRCNADHPQALPLEENSSSL